MQTFKQKYSLVFGPEQVAFLDRVLEFGILKHKDQMRISGEPYISHPVAVATILLDFGLDVATIAAAVLHDSLEDTKTTEAELRAMFGNEVATLVVGVTKLDKYKFTSQEEEQAENFRKMFFAMSSDIRVLMIKLADRLHNMRTIESLPMPRQQAMATETIEIYAPLASRLGLSYLKCELEDLCLKVLDPESYAQLASDVSLKRAERKDLVNKICQTLSDMLKELDINGEVNGRPKHFYSIYKKMKQQSKTFDQVFDLTAVRVLLPSEKDCYAMLGMIHTVWKPMPGRFKDYISMPKPNQYQSLHTTVMTSYGMPFEIQIRTFEMHKVAEYGIAAHWKYKENRTQSSALDDKLGWLRGVMDTHTESETPTEFIESIKFDLFSDQVFIFTPKGHVKALPSGSTPIDFAYSIHSDIGNKCVGAKINSRIVPLETKLNTGDYVEIMTNPNSKGPSRDWLRIAVSSQAKSKIRAFFKKEMKEENIRRGKDMLELEAKHRGYTWSSLIEPKWLNVVMSRYSISSIDDLYASVGYGGFTVNQILLKLIDFYDKANKKSAKLAAKTAQSKRSDSTRDIRVSGQDDLLVHIAKCCNPIPGDSIIGFISRGRGIAIHRTSCPNLKGIEPFRLIDAHWIQNQNSRYSVFLQIEAANSPQLLVKISFLLSEQKIPVTQLTMRLDKDGMAIVTLGAEVESIAQADQLIKKLEGLDVIKRVFRSNPQ